MGRRLSTATVVLALLFANALYAPPVEAAGFSSIPTAINGYINDIINFFGDLFSAPAPPPPAVPVPVVTPIPASPSTTTSTTVINRTIYLPATSSPAVSISGITQAQLTYQLNALQSAIEAQLPAKAIVYDTAPRSDSGQTLTNLTVSGVSGLTASDIPNLSGSYLSTAGGTVSGLSNFTNASTTLFSALGPAYFGATATSTFGADGSLTLAKALGVGSGGTGVSIPSVAGFPVEAYGAIGDGSTDDSSAIQSAINAACSAHGGKIVFGAKIYAIASNLTISCSNVYLVGQGAGGPYTGNPSAYTDSNHLGATVLKWIGSSGGTMVTFEPSNGAATEIKGGGIDGLVLAGYGVAGTGLKLRSIRGGLFPSLTVENVTSAGVDLNVTSNTIVADVYDTQNNNFGQLLINLDWNMPAVRNAIGVLMDGNETSNTSFNVFNDIYLAYESGIGVELANADSNTIGTLRAFQPSGYTGPLVGFEASTSPGGAARNNTIFYVQTTAGGVIAYGNGGSGSSHNNQILSYDNGNGGTTAPTVQSGASLAYMTTLGTTGTTTVSNALGIGVNDTSPARLYEQTSANLSNDGADFTSPNQQSLWLRPSSGIGASNPIVQSGDITEIFTNNSINTGNLVIAPWANSASGIRIVGSSGYVGISTSTPSDIFSVAGNGYFAGGLGAGVDNQTAGTIQSSGNIVGGGTLTLSGTAGTTTIASGQGFTIGGNQFVVQQGSGNIGVGTSTPSSTLAVYSINNGIATPQLWVDSNNNQASFVLNNSQASGREWQFNAGGGSAGAFASTFVLKDVTSAVTPFGIDKNDNTYLGAINSSGSSITSANLTVLNSGNVGIGTTTPNSTLDIETSNAGGIFLRNTSATDSSTLGGVFIKHTTTGTLTFQGSTGSSGSAITTTFDLANNRIGIGTTTPTSLLSLAGSNGGTTLTTLGTPTLQIENSNTTNNNFASLAFRGIDAAGAEFTGAKIAGVFTDHTAGAASADLAFLTRNAGTEAEKMRITAAGNVGIASTSPWRTLDVNGTVGFKGLTNDTADQKTLCLTANNEVVSNSGSSCITSSERFKNTIEPLDASSTLAEVMQLNPVSFYYNGNIGIPGEQVGFIAEQVEPIDPRLVVLDASGTPFTVRYENITALLAGAIQDIASISGVFRDNLIAWLGSASNGINDFFAKNIYGGNVYAQNELCIGQTCVNEQQLKALLNQAGQGSAASGASASSTPDASSISTTTPPPDTATTTADAAPPTDATTTSTGLGQATAPISDTASSTTP